jgi:hypothetical protein
MGEKRRCIGKAPNASVHTAERVRKQIVAEGLEASLKRRRSRRAYHRKADGVQEAHLMAPPKGYVRWSSRLLTDRAAQKIIDSCSHETA